MDLAKYQNRYGSKSMSDKAVLLPNWSLDWRIILAKYQLGHQYTFWTLPILIFSPVQIIMRHPLPPQHQSTYIGVPESASIEIPPFRPVFFRLTTFLSTTKTFCPRNNFCSAFMYCKAKKERKIGAIRNYIDFFYFEN